VKRSIALLRITTRAALAFALLLTISLAQEATPTTPSKGAAPRDLDSQVRELRAAIDEMRIENAESRSEMHELRQELQATRKLLGALAASTDGSPSPSPAGNATVADSKNISVT
jgi:chromosome segregation ATPase